MTTDAIQEDVSTEETPQETPVLSERELAMQAIQNEIADRYPEPAYPHQPVADVVQGEPEVEKEEKQEPAPAPVATPEKVRVKVDGEEKEVTLEELKKGYQKDTTASRRLEQAAQLQRELDQRQARLDALERQIQAASVATPSQEDEGDFDEIGAAFDALVEGDNDTAKKLMAQALKKGRTPVVATPQIDPAELAAKVKADLQAELAAEEGTRQWKEFVAENPVFADLETEEGETAILTPQRVRGDYLFAKIYGPQVEAGILSYREALNKTAEHVAKEFAPVAPPAPAPSEREQRKARIDTIPVAHGAKQVAAPKERTAADVLADMAKWRGQG